MFASLLCCLGKVPPAYEDATGDSYIQRPAVNKDVDSESRDSKNSQSSLESAGCRVTHNTQTCRSLDTSTDKKNTEVTQTRKLPVLHQRETYTGAESKQKVTVTPQKGNADSDRHALLQTVSVCRHVQNTELLEQPGHFDVLPLSLRITNNPSSDSNGSRLDRTGHGDLVNFQGDCFTFSRSRNVKELPAVLPSRFRFRSLSSISHNESQEDICFASRLFHTSTAYGADNVKINNRFLHSFKDSSCSRNPGTTTARTSGPTTARISDPTTARTSGPTTARTSGPATASTPGPTTAGIYDPIDARISSPTTARTFDSRASRNPEATAGIHPTIGRNTRMRELPVDEIHIKHPVPHRRTSLGKTWHTNDNSWKAMSGAGSHQTNTDNWNASELKHDQPSNWVFSPMEDTNASLNSTATEQTAYFRTGDTFQRRSSVAPDNREIAATQGFQKAVRKERTEKARFSWGYVVNEKLLLPSAIRQGVNPFQTARVVAPELDTPLVPARLTESGTTDVDTDLSSLEETIEPRYSMRLFSEQSTAVASCHAEMWREVVNIRSLDNDRSQQSLTHPVDEGSSFGCRGDPEMGQIPRRQASQQENFRDYIAWSGSDVSDTLSIVTEVPEPCFHDDDFHRDLQLDSDETYEDSTFDDSTVDCTLDDSAVDGTLDDNTFDDDLSEDNSHHFKSVVVTGESSLVASNGITDSTSRIHWKNNFSQVSSMQHCLPVGSQQNIEQSVHSAQYLRGNVDHEDLTDASYMFQHLDKGINIAHSTRRSQQLPREHKLKVSETLVNWPVHEEKIKSNNVTHELDNKINKSDHNSSLCSLIDSPGKSTAGGKPTLLSLANKGKEQEKSQLPQSANVKGVAATTANRTAQHLQKPHQAREDSRAALVLHDTSSECAQEKDSGIISGHSTRTNAPEQRVQPYRSTVAPASIPTIAVTSIEGQNPNEEDDDFEELFSRHHPNQQLGSRSSLADSRESIYSVYSDAGEVNYGRIPVTGEVMFHMCYNQRSRSLEVHVKQCRDLAPVDVKHDRSDPYVKTYLLPDKTRSSKRKTRIKKHTLNPVFDEILKYQISDEELQYRSLWLTVWHNDRLGRNDFLGEVTIPLDYYRFDESSPQWFPLQERTASQEPVLFYKGDLFIALKYVPADMVEAAPRKKPKLPRKKIKEQEQRDAVFGELHVLVREARNLTAMRTSAGSNPFCKGSLLPDRGRSSKQKTPVIRKTTSPAWRHILVFSGVEQSRLEELGLELTVWDHDKLSSNDFLGGVRLNLGTGIGQGQAVDWMDAREEEIEVWQSMIDQPNEWVDAQLPLRPNMDKQSVPK